MSNTSKKTVSILGIVIGVIIIIIGFRLRDTSYYSIGKPIEFGADFYTEMYNVTKDVGSAIRYAINDLICAVSWLIISLGAIDICFFLYKLVKASEVSAIEVKAKCKTDEKENTTKEQEDYYISKGGTKAGPYDIKELSEKVAQGILKPYTYVWKKGMPKWVPAKDVDGLSDLFTSPSSSNE